jgi:DNA helicase IV
VELGAADSRQAARVKGDARMARVLAKAVHDRERPLREDLDVPFGVTTLRLTVAESDRIVKAARRRFRRHNAARRFVETEVFAALAASSRIETTPDGVRERTRHLDEIRETFERMWPVLTPAELLHDLFGSRALLRLAASKWLADDEWMALHRPRHTNGQAVLWSEADLALLDEARELLGPRAHRATNGAEGEIRTYGHIVVDEVQDLTPMQLRMVARRSLNGSMTVVGDIAQATGPFAPDDWSEVLAHLPDRRPARVVELTIGYRIPGQIMAMANRILRVAAPQIAPPDAVREGDASPEVRRVGADELGGGVVAAVLALQAELGDAGIAVVAPASTVDTVVAALERDGVPFGLASRGGLAADTTVVPVELAKGLELDGVVLVEPAKVVAEERQGLRALYVALTRSTRRLTIVHAEPLPEALVDPSEASTVG